MYSLSGQEPTDTRQTPPQAFQFGSGIQLALFQGKQDKLVRFEGKSDEARGVVFGFLKGGHIQVRMLRSTWHRCHRGECLVFPTKSTELHLRVDPGEEARGILVFVPQAYLAQMSADCPHDNLGRILKCMICPDRSEESQVSQTASASIRMVADQIFSPGRAGVAGKLFMEAKTLEFFSAILQLFESHEGGLCQRVCRGADVDCLHCAAAYLRENLAENHSLASLSRQAGLNEFKLKKGFREVFNNTVFGYLREQRLEEARRLLETGRYTVIEVANQVGYTNPSKFSAAFRNQFGVNPKRYCQAWADRC